MRKAILMMLLAVVSGSAVAEWVRVGETGGEFSESEVWLFSAETLPLVAALVEARERGL